MKSSKEYKENIKKRVENDKTLNLKVKVKSKNYNIEIKESENAVKVKVNDEEFNFEEKTGKENIMLAKTSLPKRDFSEKEIKAPISGIISEIFVKENDFIKRGKKVILLSAMKMENEIVSDFEGKVKKIIVKINQNVKEGELLIILD